MAPALARTTGSRFGCSSPCALFETKSAPLQKPSLFWGSSRVHVLKVVQNGKRLGIRCQTKQSSTSACAFTFGSGPSFSRREIAEHGKLPRRDVSVAARKSRSMREMEDEEEGFQSLVKQMQSQQKKPPSAPAPPSTPKGPDPYAEFSALLDYQDQNDGLLPPSRNPRPAIPSPNTPRPVEPVKPRVISRAGAKIAGLSGLKVPTPRPVQKKGAYSVDFSTYEEPIAKTGVPTPVAPLGGATEYKLGDSGAVQVTPQGDFPVRLKGHKMPKRGGPAKKPDVNLEAPVEVPAVDYETPSQAETEREAASGLAALQAGGLASANPKTDQGLTLESFVPGRGKEYTLSEEGSDVSIASASSFPVRTKSHREPKGGYSTGADMGGEKKPEPKKPTKRVPSYQELVSGTTKIVDPTIQAVAKPPVLESKVEEVSATEPRTGGSELGADISGPRVYTLGEDDRAVSVEPAESIPVRLKALKVEKVAGSAPPENEKEKPKKVAQRVPGFQLPSDIRESGLLKKKAATGPKKESDFRPVAASRTAAADLSGGMFADAKRFLTSRRVADAGSGADVAQQTAELRGALTSALTSAQAEVLERAIAVVERKALAEAQGALIVPVVEGKKKVKGKKERAQITAAFPKWKEDYERVCIDADYTLRQLNGLAVELGRSQQSEENERGRRKGRAERADEAAKVRERDVSMTTPAVDGLEKDEKTARAVDSTRSDAAGAREEASRLARDDVSAEAPGVVESRKSGALVVESSTEERSVEVDDGVDLGSELGDDELPNWEDDPEDIDLSAYESDSDDEQPEGEAKPEFEVKLPPKRAATTEFREDDAYATFAAMLGDDDSDNDEEDTELSGEESLSRSDLDDVTEEDTGVDGFEDEVVSPSVAELPEGDSASASDTLSDASPSSAVSERSAEPSGPAAWDRERLSSQIFEMLRGTTEGEKKQFGRETPDVRSSSVRGPTEQQAPSLATLESLLKNEKRSDGVRTPSDDVRTPVDSVRTPTGSARTPEDSVRTPMGSARTPPDAVRTASDATEWSEEVQSAVAKAEAEREMARKRQAPDYGTFEELLKEEDGVKSEKPAASAPSSEELARVTRPPTLKDQRAPFVRDAKPLKPAVPTRGSLVPPAAEPSQAKKPRWVRVWDVDTNGEEDATAKEWARAEELCPNKESVEVLVVNHNSGGLQVLFGTLLGFIPASQLSLARRPPRSPEWMTRALIPKDLRNLPRSGSAQRTPLGGEKQQGTVDRTAPVDVPDESADSVGEDEVDYVTSGIVPETDEQLAIAARQVRAYRTAHLASLVGQRLTVKIIVADRAQRKLIFSERSILWKEGHEEAMSKLLARIKIGDVVRGIVKAIMKYGAFIEVDGASCLIHKSELAWVQPKHPGELLQANQEVEAVVVGVDRAIGRVNCSLKRLQPDPLTETLDSLVERAPAEGEESILTEMPELGDVIVLLKAAPGVGEVRLGRRFRGTAFAPSFQIFLSEKVDDGYRLLARVGVEVQEVLVATELERDTMKQVVRDATVSNSSERRLALADFAS